MKLEGEFRSRPNAALRPKDEAARGVIYFGYFLLDKQKKVTCRRATPTCFKFHHFTLTLALSLKGRGNKS